jgi:GIY-YIG catalytic domain
VSRRAHNSTWPEKLLYAGREYSGPTTLYQSVALNPSVGLNTFLGRLKRHRERGTLTESVIYESLYSPQDEYRRKYGTRRTIIKVEGEPVHLEQFYQAHQRSAMVTYFTFWQRAKRLKKHGFLSAESLAEALVASQSAWISFYGGGRRRPFTYDGILHPTLRGQSFTSVAAFLRTIDRYADRGLIWSRLKGGWNLDDALIEPAIAQTERKGIIYKITRRSTGQIYIGLTILTCEQRWATHIAAAEEGDDSRFAEAIRADGPEGFSWEILEEGLEQDELPNRERYWIKEHDACGPNGLNMSLGGQMGGGRRQAIEYMGESFPSIVEAAAVLSKRTGLAAHVVATRIKSGFPLPNRARRHSKHPDAGSNLWRRFLGLHHPVRGYVASGMISPVWLNNYDQFKADVAPGYRGELNLIRKDDSRSWGPDNVEWVSRKEKVQRQHGEAVVVHGRLYPSIGAVAGAFHIPESTLK